jgi:hypothetical protein
LGVRELEALCHESSLDEMAAWGEGGGGGGGVHGRWRKGCGLWELRGWGTRHRRGRGGGCHALRGREREEGVGGGAGGAGEKGLGGGESGVLTQRLDELAQVCALIVP